jgi:general secretion pathway protein D
MGTGGATGAFGTGTTGRYGASRTTGAYGQPQANQPFQAANTPGGAVPGNASFQQRLNQIVNRAAGASELQLLTDARIVPDERSNSLIVYANKGDMKMITNIVSKVDVLLAQVLIEGVVLSVSLNDEQSLGVSWLQKPVSLGNNSVGTGGINNGQGFLTNLTDIASSLPSGFSYFGKLGRNFDVSLSALATDGRVRVLQRPRIQTSHATPAAFFTGSSVPFVSAVNNYAYLGSGNQSSSIDVVQVGVGLNVTPYITPDGLVVMEIDQEISAIDKTLTIDGNPVPQTATRRASATLSVHDNESIMLGGYIEDTRVTGKSGVPILKDIPLLGALFRSKNNNKTRSELLLLMHVSILKNPMATSDQVEAEKAKLPGIFEADKEFKKTEEQSLKKAGLPQNKTDGPANKP